MKGGQTPIHFMKWAASDFVNDPWVKLAVSRNDTGAIAFYALFLNLSFMEGGYLPADPDLLAGVVGLKVETVRAALDYWASPDCGKVRITDGRAWNPRVIRDIASELKYRRAQKALGKKGGRPPKKDGGSGSSGGSSGNARQRVAKGKPKGRVLENLTPPSPSPSPSPSPAPSPTPPPPPPREAERSEVEPNAHLGGSNGGGGGVQLTALRTEVERLLDEDVAASGIERDALMLSVSDTGNGSALTSPGDTDSTRWLEAIRDRLHARRVRRAPAAETPREQPSLIGKADELAAEARDWIQQNAAPGELQGQALVRWFREKGITYGTPTAVAVGIQLRHLTGA